MQKTYVINPSISSSEFLNKLRKLHGNFTKFEFFPEGFTADEMTWKNVKLQDKIKVEENFILGPSDVIYLWTGDFETAMKLVPCEKIYTVNEIDIIGENLCLD